MTTRNGTKPKEDAPTTRGPHDLQVERAVLGSILLDNGCWDDVKPIVRAHDFFFAAHQEIFKSMENLFAKNDMIDLLMVRNDLLARKKLDDVGGVVELAGLEQSVLSTGAAPELARMVRSFAIARRAMERFGEASARLSGGEPAADVLEDVRSTVAVMQSRMLLDEAVPMPIEESQALLPKFPVDALPWFVRDWVLDVARTSQTVPCYPACIALGAFAIALGGKLQVRVAPDFFEPVNLYLLPAMPTGEGKSRAVSLATKEIWDVYRENMANAKKDAAESRMRRKRIEAAMKRAMKGITDGDPDAEAEYLKLEEQLSDIATDKPAEIISSDATPEGLVTDMQTNHGHANVIDTEGTVFSIMMGRYNSGEPNVEIYLKSYMREPVVITRKGADKIVVPRASMNILVTVQPAVVAKLSDRKGMEEVGLLPRFLYAFPGMVERREIVEEAPNQSMRDAFSRAIRAACDWPGADPPVQGFGRERCLSLSPEAMAHVKRLNDFVQDHGRKAGQSHYNIAGWMKRLVGHAVRIAGVLHAMEGCHNVGGWYERPITGRTMEAAVAIAHGFFLPHAIHAYHLMGVSGMSREDKEGTILSWMRRTGRDFYTWNDIFRAFGATWKAPEIQETLGGLDNRGWIRTMWPKNSSAKKPLGWMLHPVARSRITE